MFIAYRRPKLIPDQCECARTHTCVRSCATGARHREGDGRGVRRAHADTAAGAAPAGAAAMAQKLWAGAAHVPLIIILTLHASVAIGAHRLQSGTGGSKLIAKSAPFRPETG